MIERLLDEAAVALGPDPAEIRRRNLVRIADLPYRTATGFEYGSGDYERMLDRCLEIANWEGSPEGRLLSEPNVDSVPVRAVAVERALAEGATAAEAAKLAADGLDPPGTLRATPAFKLHLTRVLTRRVIETAASRAP